MNYERFINDRAASLKPSGIRRFFDLVNEKKDAISLGVGTGLQHALRWA